MCSWRCIVCCWVWHSHLQGRHFRQSGLRRHPLQADHPQVHTTAQPLPTFAELNERVKENKRVSVKDVWGLMLCQVPGELLGTSLPALPGLLVMWAELLLLCRKDLHAYT